jgi:AcrR family transcriptional regulator
MRRLGAALGIRAPSLYKHFPDKAAVEAALLDEGFRDAAAALEAGVRSAAEPVAAFAAAYRAFAAAHPHLYRLMTAGPLPRARLTPGVESSAAAPLLRVTGGDPARARALWGLAHGLATLELDGRFPPGADVDAAWAAGVAAFAGPRPRPRPRRQSPPSPTSPAAEAPAAGARALHERCHPPGGSGRPRRDAHGAVDPAARPSAAPPVGSARRCQANT